MSSVSEPAVAQPGNPELPTVSAVIPAYNAADTIERALNSVYAQTYENIIEVIVVDDGSTDDTAQIIRDKFPQATLIQQENGGNAAARNTGVAAATGEYIAFLDADDEWLPEKTEVQMDVARRHPGLSVLLCRSTEAHGRGLASTRRMELHQFSFRDWIAAVPFGSGFCSCFSGWVARRTALDDIGGLDRSLRQCVDNEMLLRTTALGYSVGGATVVGYVRNYRTVSVSRGPRAFSRALDIMTTIVRSYDPSAGGWRSQLLSQAEYDQWLKSVLVSAGLRSALYGDAAAAKRQMIEATSLKGGSWRQGVAARTGALSPTLLRIGWRILSILRGASSSSSPHQ